MDKVLRWQAREQETGGGQALTWAQLLTLHKQVWQIINYVKSICQIINHELNIWKMKRRPNSAQISSIGRF